MSDNIPTWLQRLISQGKSQGFLTYAQVNDGLPLTMVDPLEIEQIANQLKHSGILVVPDS